MTVHVVGRAPVADAGEYYRIPFDRWRRVLAALRVQHGGIVDEAVLEEMVYNHGAGILDDEACLALAERLRRLAGSPRWAALLDEVLEADRALQSLAQLSAPAAPPEEHAGLRAQLDADVERWIRFLENCGGFAVW
jgi:hypothetical protein